MPDRQLAGAHCHGTLLQECVTAVCSVLVSGFSPVLCTAMCTILLSCTDSTVRTTLHRADVVAVDCALCQGCSSHFITTHPCDTAAADVCACMRVCMWLQGGRCW